jgi:hypothetical protein
MKELCRLLMKKLRAMKIWSFIIQQNNTRKFGYEARANVVGINLELKMNIRESWKLR